MATLRNKRKLAAVSRETLEVSRSSRRRNVLDPELTQDYISQVSEEIEGRVTKKLSKEFNKTESRILGALSKLDEFLLNPQVRTCSVVQGASRNANSENREIHGNCSSTDPLPEGGYFHHHSGQLNSPETEFNSHVVTETYPHSGQTKKMKRGSYYAAVGNLYSEANQSVAKLAARSSMYFWVIDDKANYFPKSHLSKLF